MDDRTPADHLCTIRRHVEKLILDGWLYLPALVGWYPCDVGGELGWLADQLPRHPEPLPTEALLATRGRDFLALRPHQTPRRQEIFLMRHGWYMRNVCARGDLAPELWCKPKAGLFEYGRDRALAHEISSTLARAHERHLEHKVKTILAEKSPSDGACTAIKSSDTQIEFRRAYAEDFCTLRARGTQLEIARARLDRREQIRARAGLLDFFGYPVGCKEHELCIRKAVAAFNLKFEICHCIDTWIAETQRAFEVVVMDWIEGHRAPEFHAPSVMLNKLIIEARP